MELKNKNLKFKIKLQLCDEGKGLGPGMKTIMELVDKEGSLTGAYRIMGISPSKGWKIIKLAEEELGVKLLAGQSGGAGGGKSVLTEEGKAYLKLYQEVESKLLVAANDLLQTYLNEND